MKVKNNKPKYLGHRFTGITIGTKMCFRKSRIEIKAKLPKGHLLSAAAFMSSFEYMCQQGDRNGQVDIAKFYNNPYSNEGSDFFQSTLHYGSGDLRDSSKKSNINSSDWIIFGIEWSDTYLQTYVDGKVVYHANTRQSQWGKFIQATKSRYYLPFDHSFNLMLHIGVSSFQFNTRSYDIGEDKLMKLRMKNWVLPVFEIDYVRVYGESVEGFPNDTIILNTQNDLPRIDSSIIYAFIGVVTILVVLIIIVIYYFRRKLEQTNNQDNYYDIREAYNEYDEFDYDYAYEAVHYTNEEINEINQEHNHEYLVLTDPLAENMDNKTTIRNNEKIV